MNEGKAAKSIPEVPRLIYESFLEELSKAGTDPEVVKRLKNTIITEDSLSVAALRASMFPDETL